MQGKQNSSSYGVLIDLPREVFFVSLSLSLSLFYSWAAAALVYPKMDTLPECYYSGSSFPPFEGLSLDIGDQTGSALKINIFLTLCLLVITEQLRIFASHPEK
jgi:hypothetical protein